MKRNLVFAVVLALVLTAAFVSAILVAQLRIPAVGVVKAVGLEVYADEACTVPLTQIDWGLLAPGENKSVACYVKSTSTMYTTLALSVGNWVPSLAGNYILVNWDCEGAVIAPGEVFAATVTLHVDSDIQGVDSFSFDIMLSIVEAN